MEKLKGLYPEPVFRCFEELCGIPHASYHINEISDYLKSFAERRGFSCVQDAEKNILIRVPATAGYEEEETLILQGHMDMVAVHEDASVDPCAFAPEVKHDGEWVYAEASSLGGDDGIAVAMMMALMEDPSCPHPALELLITTNEEVGMDGAVGFDASLLQGRRLLNLDSEDEGIFTAGCAGGVRVVAKLPLEKAKETLCGSLYRITISGGLGGHSGQMIHKGRGNANRLLGRVLYKLAGECGAVLEKIAGGTACNAIPQEASMKVVIPEGKTDKAEKLLEELRKDISHEYHGRDDALVLSWKEDKKDYKASFSKESSEKAGGLLIAEPDGVQAMSGVVDGLVETSLNLGILKLEEGELKAYYELRSMIGSAAQHLKERVAAIAGAFGAEAEISASYPEWEYRESSPLRDKMVKVFERMYGHAPKTEVIHAGLECGVLAKKIPGFDAVSIGPDMQDIHTTKERLNIASVGRVWDFVLQVLGEKDCNE